MLTCPHCNAAITAADVTEQRCPHCQRSFSTGQTTLETNVGQATVEEHLPPDSAADSGTVGTIDLPLTAREDRAVHVVR